MNFEVRDYRRTDFRAVVKLISNIQKWFCEIDSSGEVKDFETDEDVVLYAKKVVADAESMNGLIVVAEYDGELVGFVQGVVINHAKDLMHQLTHKTNTVGWVGLLYVEAEYRNLGVGRMMVKHLREHFVKNNCELIKIKVSADNPLGGRVYSKMGFYKTGLEMSLRV